MVSYVATYEYEKGPRLDFFDFVVIVIVVKNLHLYVKQ